MDRFSCFLLSNNWKRRKPSATCPCGKICLPLETISDRFICSQVWLNGPCFLTQFFSKFVAMYRSQFIDGCPSKIILSLSVVKRSSHRHFCFAFCFYCVTSTQKNHNNNNKTQIKTNKITSSSSMIFKLFLSPINKHFFSFFHFYTR